MSGEEYFEYVCWKSNIIKIDQVKEEIEKNSFPIEIYSMNV